MGNNIVYTFLLSLILAGTGLSYGADEKVIPLYEGIPPGSETWKKDERSETNALGEIVSVWNVVKPTLTVFPANPQKATGAGIIICPGGGFFMLSVDHEGYAVARFLAERGVTCFVLKYRTVQCLSAKPMLEFMVRSGEAQKHIPIAVEDARVAVKYLKTNAKELGIKPNKIGIMGFSAGGIVTLSVASDYTRETRPAFAAPIYGAMDLEKEGKTIPSDAPPIFLAVTSDDPFNFASHSASVYRSWLKAKRSAELHIYSKGGHGFGMNKQNLPCDSWIDQLTDWLEVQGVAKK